MIMILIMMTVHLSLHPDLSIVPGHPNLPGDSTTTESDDDNDDDVIDDDDGNYEFKEMRR